MADTQTRSTDYLDLFTKMIARIHKLDPQGIFFVASNQVDIIDKFSAVLKPTDGYVFIRYPLLYADRNNLEGVRDAVVEWYLLGKTIAIIGTYQSSYSEEAAFFTESLKKYNVGPTTYLTNFHSIVCFDEQGVIIERPFSAGIYDPCVQYSLNN